MSHIGTRVKFFSWTRPRKIEEGVVITEPSAGKWLYGIKTDDGRIVHRGGAVDMKASTINAALEASYASESMNYIIGDVLSEDTRIVTGAR